MAEKEFWQRELQVRKDERSLEQDKKKRFSVVGAGVQRRGWKDDQGPGPGFVVLGSGGNTTPALCSPG